MFQNIKAWVIKTLAGLRELKDTIPNFKEN